MDQHKDDTKRPDGRRGKKRADTAKKQIQQSYMSSWWVKDDTRDPKEGKDEGLKHNNNKTKQKVTETKQS